MPGRTEILTRNEMKAILAGGGTVLHKGKHIKDEAELPSEADLAIDNKTEEGALASLDEQLKSLLAEREKLSAAVDKKSAKEEPKAEVKSEARVEVKPEVKKDDKGR